MELTLSDASTILGLIYCTDEISQSIVVQRSLVHTTLSSEITVVHAPSIASSKTIEIQNGKDDNSEDNIQKYGVANINEIKNTKLCNVSKKALEEREKRAWRLAEESFRHVNQTVRR